MAAAPICTSTNSAVSAAALQRSQANSSHDFRVYLRLHYLHLTQMRRAHLDSSAFGVGRIGKRAHLQI